MAGIFCRKQADSVIDMALGNMADMVNADCLHIRWLDALCPVFLVCCLQLTFLRVKCSLSMTGDDFDVFCMFVSKAAYNVIISLETLGTF